MILIHAHTCPLCDSALTLVASRDPRNPGLRAEETVCGSCGAPSRLYWRSYSEPARVRARRYREAAAICRRIAATTTDPVAAEVAQAAARRLPEMADRLEVRGDER